MLSAFRGHEHRQAGRSVRIALDPQQAEGVVAVEHDSRLTSNNVRLCCCTGCNESGESERLVRPVSAAQIAVGLGIIEPRPDVVDKFRGQRHQPKP
jgi:hypothetical protein